MLCRQQVAELAEAEQRFAERDARLVVIGNGTPNFMGPFRKATGYRGRLYSDPSLDVYKTMDYKRSLASMFGAQTLGAGFQALKGGHLQKGIQGDALQLGGAVVIGPDGVVLYYFQSQVAGDHPPVAELLGALG